MRRKLQLKQIDLHLDDQAVNIGLTVEDLKDASNNVIGEKLTLVDTALQNALSGLASDIATVQADVDQNEVDSDAAEAQLATDISNEINARISGDSALQTQITSNDGDISALQTQANAIQGELDATQIGAGLSSTGAYVPVNGRPFIANATSLDDADDLLAQAIDQEITDRQAAIDAALASEMSFRGDLDASSTTPFSSFSTIAKGDMWVVTTAGSKLDQDLEAGDMVIAKVAGAQLGQSPLEFAYVQKNFDLSSYATVSAMNAAIAVVQADVDQNEIDSDAGIAANATDIAQNASDIVSVIGGAGLDSNGGYTAPASGASNYLGSATHLKDADIRLDTQIGVNETNINNLAGSLTQAAGFDFCQYYDMVEADLNSLGASQNPEIRFQANPLKTSLDGKFTIDYDEVAPTGMAQETILSKVLVTLNGLQLKGKVGPVDSTHEYGIISNVNGSVNELAIEFMEGLLDGGDVVCIMVARGA